MQIEIQEMVNSPKPKKVIGTQISQDLYDKLKQESDDQFMSLSDLLRKIIYVYYRNLNETEKESN